MLIKLVAQVKDAFSAIHQTVTDSATPTLAPVKDSKMEVDLGTQTGTLSTISMLHNESFEFLTTRLLCNESL